MNIPEFQNKLYKRRKYLEALELLCGQAVAERARKRGNKDEYK